MKIAGITIPKVGTGIVGLLVTILLAIFAVLSMLIGPEDNSPPEPSHPSQVASDPGPRTVAPADVITACDRRCGINEACHRACVAEQNAQELAEAKKKAAAFEAQESGKREAEVRESAKREARDSAKREEKKLIAKRAEKNPPRKRRETTIHIPMPENKRQLTVYTW